MNRDSMLADLTDLRDQLDLARQRVEDLEADRDRLMLATADAGAPVTEIVKAAGVTRARFYQIEAKRKTP